MQVFIITALCIILLVSIVFLICTLKVREKVLKVFKCKHCLKTNKKLNKVCEYCGTQMGIGYSYNSTLLGKRNCKDSSGIIDMDLTDKHIKIDISLWVAIISVSILGIVYNIV